MEGLNQEFRLAIEEVQELTKRAAIHSSQKLIKINLKAIQYYRMEVGQRIDYIQEMIEIFPFKTDVFYVWIIHKNLLKLLSMILNGEDQGERLKKVDNYGKVLEKFRNETTYSYWKNYISTNGNGVLQDN